MSGGLGLRPRVRRHFLHPRPGYCWTWAENMRYSSIQMLNPGPEELRSLRCSAMSRKRCFPSNGGPLLSSRKPERRRAGLWCSWMRLAGEGTSHALASRLERRRRLECGLQVLRSCVGLGPCSSEVLVPARPVGLERSLQASQTKKVMASRGGLVRST